MNIMMDTMTIWVFVLFILINSVKITLFNQYVLDNWKPENVIYKFLHTITVMGSVYILLGNYFPNLLIPFYILQLAYLGIYASYYSFYHYYLQILEGLRLFRESFDVFSRNSTPKNSRLLFLGIDIPFFIIMFLRLHGRDTSRINDVQTLILTCLLSVLLLESYNLFKGRSLIKLLNTYPKSEKTVIENYGTLANAGVNLIKFHQYEEFMKAYDYGNVQSIKSKGYRRPNILIIQLESVDSHAVEHTHDGKLVMPYMNALKNNAICFPYTLNYHKAGGTSDAEFSILNSVEPLGNFPSIMIPSYEFKNSFVKILGEAGYETAVYHGNHGDYYHRDKAFAKMGFGKFFDLENMGINEVGWGAPDHEVFDFVLENMKKQTQPSFNYVITMTNHCRFTNARKYHNDPRFDDIRHTDYRNYLNSLSYVDKATKAFVESVQQQDKDACIIMVGDHTPGLDKKVYQESSLKSEGRHLEFVPLFLLAPGHHAYLESEKAASFLDIAPTVLQLANIDTLYNTYGQGLLTPEDLKEKIPYRDFMFDRKTIYGEINKSIP